MLIGLGNKRGVEGTKAETDGHAAPLHTMLDWPANARRLQAQREATQPGGRLGFPHLTHHVSHLDLCGPNKRRGQFQAHVGPETMKWPSSGGIPQQQEAGGRAGRPVLWARPQLVSGPGWPG